jgi:hypothetical protein
MRQLSKSKRRVAGLLGAGALLIGGIGAPVLFAAGPASAATCTTIAPCSITGTATLGAGTLTATMPDSLTWGATLTGVTQNLVDAVPADQGYTVDDASGATSGWNISVAATTFTSTVPTAATLPDAGTFSTNGSVTSATAATAPTAACTSGAGTCTLPTDAVTYPVPLPTDGTATVIYSAAALTGEGSIDIGGSAAAAPVGWWLSVRPDAAPGTYTSTVTISVASGP